MNLSTSRTTFALALLLCCVGGCKGDAKVKRTPIQGAVTLDGQPLKVGVIEFSPVTSKLGSGGKISGGRYQLPADKGLSPGDYLVRITSAGEPPAPMSVAPGMEQGPTPLAKERIAARFNAETTLKLTVPAQATSLEQNFDTSSK